MATPILLQSVDFHEGGATIRPATGNASTGDAGMPPILLIVRSLRVSCCCALSPCTLFVGVAPWRGVDASAASAGAVGTPIRGFCKRRQDYAGTSIAREAL